MAAKRARIPCWGRFLVGAVQPASARGRDFMMRTAGARIMSISGARRAQTSPGLPADAHDAGFWGAKMGMGGITARWCTNSRCPHLAQPLNKLTFGFRRCSKDADSETAGALSQALASTETQTSPRPRSEVCTIGTVAASRGQENHVINLCSSVCGPQSAGSPRCPRDDAFNTETAAVSFKKGGPEHRTLARPLQAPI